MCNNRNCTHYYSSPCNRSFATDAQRWKPLPDPPFQKGPACHSVKSQSYQRQPVEPVGKRHPQHGALVYAVEVREEVRRPRMTAAFVLYISYQPFLPSMACCCLNLADQLHQATLAQYFGLKHNFALGEASSSGMRLEK